MTTVIQYVAVIAGLTIGLAVVLTLWRYIRVQEHLLAVERRRFEEESARYAREQFESSSSSLARMRGFDPDQPLTSRAFERGIGRLDSELRRIARALGRERAYLATGSQGPEGKGGEPKPSWSDDVLRDIAHSLNTPISQIESVAATEASDLQQASASLRRVGAALDVIKAFMSAFRALDDVATSAVSWQPSTLGAALRSASDVYRAAADNPRIAIHIDVPDQVAGFDNTFVLAALLPLLENAIDASVDGEDENKVTITTTSSDGETAITISNPVGEPPPLDDMFTVGFTTKDGHEGRGLHVSQRLVSSRAGCRLTNSYENGAIEFSLLLRV